MESNILEKAEKCLKWNLCDHCLGRQFAQLLSGYSNDERGKILRTAVGMNIDKQRAESEMEMSNFSDFKFHNLEIKNIAKNKICYLCNGLFEKIDALAKKAAKTAGKYEFSNFLVGTKLSFELAEKEEDFWEKVGIEYCEPLKAETNREIGKRIEQLMKKKFNPKNPDINIIIDLEKNKIETLINPLFIYGEYQKLVRGIPQTKWPSGKYKNSVEQIIAKPIMPATNGSAHKFHGHGREDIDARCLAWRPFVLEILQPKKRNINLKNLAKKIDTKRVRIRNIQFSNVAEMRKIKESRAEKTYSCIVVCDNVKKADLKKLSLLSLIHQKTPQRVLHRRADLMRKRNVKQLNTKYVNSKKFLLTVRTDAGLYIKELVSGDEGRTKPSISELLGQKCVCKDLDVIGIDWKK